MTSYAERVTRFWEWFEDHEAEVSDALENVGNQGADRAVGLLGGGLDRVIEGIGFDISRPFGLHLAPGAHPALYFLTTRLVAAQPESLKAKWNVTAWKPPVGEGFALGLGDVSITAKDVRVKIDHEPGTSTFSLSVFSHCFAHLDDAKALGAFCVLLNNTIGENVALSHIARVKRCAVPDADWIPLSALPGVLEQTLADEGVEFLENPCEAVTRYESRPFEGGLRSDVVAGFTCLTQLTTEFYENADAPTWTRLAQTGTKGVFLSYLHEEDTPVDALDVRYEIAESLEAEVLGDSGNGGDIGIVLGQACGLKRCYIDLLLFDEKAFLSRVHRVFDRYDGVFDLFEFRPNGAPVTLE